MTVCLLDMCFFYFLVKFSGSEKINKINKTKEEEAEEKRKEKPGS